MTTSPKLPGFCFPPLSFPSCSFLSVVPANLGLGTPGSGAVQLTRAPQGCQAWVQLYLGYFHPRTKPLESLSMKGQLPFHYLCSVRTSPELAGLHKTYLIPGNHEDRDDFLSKMGAEPCGSRSVWASLKAQGCFPVH